MARYKLGSINLSSSVDPEKLATTVRGIILGGSTLIIFLGMQFFGITLTPNDVGELAINLSGFVATLATAYGLLQKLVAWGTRVRD